ncbi:helix-turn-helix domain-containing protein [Candidatus Chloroploca asiatica]|uniref:helix-turn-helix domain-containing protein n=1 Tax=Candidatus Chloroploca asiatica TaxID=1506545 RepID=UPI0011418C5C|nr:helix-turn-helix domain-containing protein [Candidatus Chloroploca asiatica]
MIPSTTAETVAQLLQSRWQGAPSPKTQKYINTFFDIFTLRNGLYAKVQGNHGVYRVSIFEYNDQIDATCSCYIGKHGYCHHCEALARTFLLDATTIPPVPAYHIADVRTATTPEQINQYIRSTALAELLQELERNRISIKSVAASLGVSPQRIRALIKKEQHQGVVDELTPIKLSCLWLLDQLNREKPR